MIPKFTRPLSAFTLYVLATASWFVGAALLLKYTLELDTPGTGVWSQYLTPVLAVPAVFLVSGIILLSLGRIIHLSAETAHYTKYLCWELRITNQLIEKTNHITEQKKSEQRKIPPPLQHFHEMDPMEKVYRSAIH